MGQAAQNQRSRAGSAASTARSPLPLRTRPRAETPPGHGPAPRHLRQDVEHLCFRGTPAPRVCCALGTEIGSRAGSDVDHTATRLLAGAPHRWVVLQCCSAFYEDLERMNDPHACTSHNAAPPTRDWVICLDCQSCASCAPQLPLIKLCACCHCTVAHCKVKNLCPLLCPSTSPHVVPGRCLPTGQIRRAPSPQIQTPEQCSSPCHKHLCCESRTHGPRG